MLYALFNCITREIPKEYKEAEHISIPNFLKLDSYYRDEMLRSFITRVYNDSFEKTKLDNFAKIFGGVNANKIGKSLEIAPMLS